MKFTFSKILMGQGEVSEKYTLRVQYCQAPSGTFISFHFPKDFIEVYDLNGALVEFLADPQKKAIAFRKILKIKPEEINKKTMRYLKMDKFGVAQTGASNILKAIGVKFDHYKCPIETYKDSVYGDVWYVVFNEETKYVPRSRKQNEARV